MNLKFKALGIVRPIMAMFDATEVEDSLWIFDDSTSALQAAIKMK